MFETPNDASDDKDGAVINIFAVVVVDVVVVDAVDVDAVVVDVVDVGESTWS